MKTWTLVLAALAVSGVASGANAQQAQPPDPATVVVPASTCEQPPTSLGFKSTPPEDNRFRKRVATYGTCMKEYALGLESIAKQYEAVAQKYLDVGNKAITDYNDYMKAVNDAAADNQ